MLVPAHSLGVAVPYMRFAYGRGRKLYRFSIDAGRKCHVKRHLDFLVEGGVGFWRNAPFHLHVNRRHALTSSSHKSAPWGFRLVSPRFLLEGKCGQRNG